MLTLLCSQILRCLVYIHYTRKVDGSRMFSTKVRRMSIGSPQFFRSRHTSNGCSWRHVFFCSGYVEFCSAIMKHPWFAGLFHCTMNVSYTCQTVSVSSVALVKQSSIPMERSTVEKARCWKNNFREQPAIVQLIEPETRLLVPKSVHYMPL